MSITSQSTLISKARLFMVGVSPSLFRFSSVSALPSSYQLRTAAEKSPHCGRAAPALFSFSVMRQQEAGVAIRSSVHRTSVLQRLKWLGTPASCLRERVGVFVKQKHRSTPFGALAPTRSRLLQSNGRTRSESFRNPAAPPETLRSSHARKPRQKSPNFQGAHGSAALVRFSNLGGVRRNRGLPRSAESISY